MPHVSDVQAPFFLGFPLTISAGQVTTSGNTQIVAPMSGAKVRVHYCSYNPTAAAEVGFRFGSAGTIFLRNNVTAGSVIAKDFGEMRHIEGAPDEALFLNQNVAVITNWTVFYTDH